MTKTDAVAHTYDLNGNLLNDGIRSYEYDALNRLKKIYKTPATPVLVGEYTYDAVGRRVRKVITNGGVSGTVTNATTDFVYDGQQCCEERDAVDATTKHYVWGLYIDELSSNVTTPTEPPLIITRCRTRCIM